MKSLVGTIINKAPIPYTTRSNITIPWRSPTGVEAQMRAMGSVGTLFAIVSRLANSTAQVEWKLWRKAASGRREDRVEVTRHLALDIWHNPNPFMTTQELVESIQQHIDLTGEGWLVVGRNPRATIPLELWPVRPDRMTPVPDPIDYLAGYVYTGPEGQQVPLQLDEVIQLRMPNPLDPYRGMGPVQALLVDLDSARYSAEWNRNFFLNGAEPGGIVEVPNNLQDPEFNQFTSRWREQHQGVANAHRVAILEGGAKWVDRAFSQRDMQFVELRQVSRDTILEAFGVPKSELGIVEDVNRANAETGSQVFAGRLIVPRLERIKQALNSDFLPLFGTTGQGLEFDYASPIPQDPAAEDTSLVARTTAALNLVNAGYDRRGVLAAVDLPDIPTAPLPAAPPTPAVAAPRAPALPAPAARLDIHHHALPAAGHTEAAGSWSLYDLARARPRPVLTAQADDADLPADELPDVTPVLEALNTALDALMADWADLTQDQKAALVEAVRQVAEDGHLSDLADLTVDTAAAAAALTAAMTALAATAGQQIVAEAAAQGVTIEAATVAAATVEQVAEVVASLLGRELAVSAARAAIVANGADATADEVADAVAEHLDSLSDAGARKQVGGALHGSMNAARIATLKAAPSGAVYSTEVNDRNTCEPCRTVNGTWLGNTDDLAQVEKSYPGGAYGGYVLCEGGVNCRGTIVGVWRPKQVKQ